MGEFNVNKSDGSLEQTAGMPSEYPAAQVMMSDGTTSVEEALDSMRFYTINVPATAINTKWGSSSIYYATITLDAPENLTGKKVFMRFESSNEYLILGWSARVLPNGTKISFSMNRPDNTGTISGKLYLMVKD